MKKLLLSAALLLSIIPFTACEKSDPIFCYECLTTISSNLPPYTITNTKQQICDMTRTEIADLQKSMTVTTETKTYIPGQGYKILRVNQTMSCSRK